MNIDEICKDMRFVIDGNPGEHVYHWAVCCIDKIKKARPYTNKQFFGMFNDKIILINEYMTPEEIVKAWDDKC